ncbi:bifunctional homocysteine S-methyltransferase/methylenetetrahydrofolate reductase [Fodinisporobacter ferrooxydans]|uniref:Bifunctional homocysteine S-methyltransferase/methylenetetrahydrofolate reductase n=2 Tax=Fodinisporobacter ferrooxydans TaxID=2901836 RepID=A0ABY4CR31_9BACL|nr:bifunctional homocysteine S-methyltransferase/methylenetetrahydrofolate reductase [Alicyclobacillaceae bacterium MYW30-H2]
MGTYLYQLGIPVGISYEELNISKPDMIINVHAAYKRAGAKLIQTNTYSAQREKLMKFGLESQVKDINKAAVELARTAAGEDAYVLGTVGSITGGIKRKCSEQILVQNYQEQLHVLLENHVDGIVLETFYDISELQLALNIVKKLSDSIPVICQLAIEDAGYTFDGTKLSDAFQQLLDQGADIVGLNCRSGPSNMIRSFEKLPQPFHGFLSAYPNAGLPAYIDGEYVYASTPSYFGKSAVILRKMGVKIIGGCCGTTPEHIRAIAEGLAGTSKADDNSGIPGVSGFTFQHPPIQVTELKSRNDGEPFNHLPVSSSNQPTLPQMANQRRTVIVELDPPKTLQIGKFIEGAHALKEAGADALTMADNSLAMTRMSNMALGQIVKDQVGILPLLHIACRDRNLIGQQSHLMGLHALGIDHLLAITGDPSRFGDFPGATSVYDLSSFDLLHMIDQMNQGLSYSGKPLKDKSKFTVATAFNPNVRFLDKAVKRLERKITSGAQYVMTQPVYDPQVIKQIYELTSHLDVPIFIGIMPLLSSRNAEFLHNEVPGIQLSEDILQRMAKYEGEDARKQGVEIAIELLDTAMQYFKGIYLMTPLLRYDMTVELTRYVLGSK